MAAPAAAPSVATTILRQLGGNRFTAMTGARDLIGDHKSLRMRLPANLTKRAATHLQIVLLPDDTYSLRLQRKRGMSGVVELDYRTGIHVEQLRAAFTDLTGLETSL